MGGEHSLCRTCVATAQRDPPLQENPVLGSILPSKPAKTFPAEQISRGNMKLMQLPDEVLSSILAALPWKAKVNAACTCKRLNARDPLRWALGPDFQAQVWRPRLEDGPEQPWCGMWDHHAEYNQDRLKEFAEKSIVQALEFLSFLIQRKRGVCLLRSGSASMPPHELPVSRVVTCRRFVDEDHMEVGTTIRSGPLCRAVAFRRHWLS